MSKKENEEYFKNVDKSGSDPLHDLIKLGSGFDWITPLADIIRGFNTIEMDVTLNEKACKDLEKALKKQGVTCRTQFVIDQGWRVISKR